jgi:hypothetical protein
MISKRRIEIKKIDARIGKFLPIRKPFQVVAEIQPIHWTTINQNSRLATKSLSLFRRAPAIYRLGSRPTTRFKAQPEDT